MIQSNTEKIHDETLPSKLLRSHIEFKLVGESSYYRVFEATSIQNGELHTIRTLNLNSDLVRKNYSHAATLFGQEILRIANRIECKEDFVMIENFEIENQKIAFVTKALAGLALPPKHHALDLEKLIKDIMEDINFLYSKMKLSDLNLDNTTILYAEDCNSFFLSDWSTAKPIHSEDMTKELAPTINVTPELKIPRVAVKEMYKLGLITLNSSGLPSEDYGELLETKDEFAYINLLETLSKKLEDIKQPKTVQRLVHRILQKEANHSEMTLAELLKKRSEEDEEEGKRRDSQSPKKLSIIEVDKVGSRISPKTIFETYESVMEYAKEDLKKVVVDTRKARRAAKDSQEYLKICEDYLASIGEILNKAKIEVLKDAQIDYKEFTTDIAHYMQEGNEEVELIHSMIPQRITLSLPASYALDKESLKLVLGEEVEYISKNLTALKALVKEIDSPELVSLLIRSKISDYVNSKFKIEDEDILAELEAEDVLVDLDVQMLMRQFQEGLVKIAPMLGDSDV